MFDKLPLALISRGWLHIDVFIHVKFPLEVGAVEVKCVYFPVVAHGDGKDGAETGEPCYWGECVKVINAKLLHESACYKAHLILLNGSI